MTKHEMAVAMMKEGIEAFKEVNNNVSLSPNDAGLAISLLPIMLGCSCQAVMYAHYMKRLDRIIEELQRASHR